MRVAIVAGAAALAVAAPAQGAPGAVDSTFGPPSGILAEPGEFAAGATLAPTSDGRVLLAGALAEATGPAGFVTRLTAAGAVDPGFGVRRMRFGAGDMPPQRFGAVVAGLGGRTLLAGVAGPTWSATRLLPDGSTDPFYGAGGTVLLDVGGRGLNDITGPVTAALLPDGRLVMAGSVPDAFSGEKIAVARLNAIGQRDPSFGANGLATLQLGRAAGGRAPRSAATGMVVALDGGVTLAGRASGSAGERAVLVRLTAAGRPDSAFGTGGRVITQYGRTSLEAPAYSSFEALAAASGDGLLAAGFASDVAGSSAVLAARFTADGRPVRRFGRDGALVTQMGPGGAARTAGFAADGAAVLAGEAGGGALTVRLAPSGAVDCGYGTGGRTVAPYALPPADPGQDPSPRVVQEVAAAAVGADGSATLTGSHAAGVFVGRIAGGPSVTTARAAPVVQTLRPRYAGRGEAILYGVVDPRCQNVNVRFVVKDAAGRRVHTALRRVRGRLGPQTICARVRGLRAGRRYTVALPTARTVAFRAWRRIPLRRGSVQEGC